MQENKLRNLFRYHAGLTAFGSGGSFVEVLALEPLDLDRVNASLLEVFELLQQLNVQLNGEVPSDNKKTSESVGVVEAYAVSQMLIELENVVSINQGGDLMLALSTVRRKLILAWDAVLAGDIDDIAAEVQLETSADE